MYTCNNHAIVSTTNFVSNQIYRKEEKTKCIYQLFAEGEANIVKSSLARSRGIIQQCSIV